METNIVEKKVRCAKRTPPGDVWQPISNPEVKCKSLTDVLEFVFNKTGSTKFFMDAREGYVYVVETEEQIKPVEPIKKYSLYGED
jgi:hypothetical protein